MGGLNWTENRAQQETIHNPDFWSIFSPPHNFFSPYSVPYSVHPEFFSGHSKIRSDAQPLSTPPRSPPIPPRSTPMLHSPPPPTPFPLSSIIPPIHPHVLINFIIHTLCPQVFTKHVPNQRTWYSITNIIHDTDIANNHYT